MTKPFVEFRKRITYGSVRLTVQARDGTTLSCDVSRISELSSVFEGLLLAVVEYDGRRDRELPPDMVKLDAKFTGVITKVKDGSVVPDDEWMVFLAKDNAFPAALAYYRARCVGLGCDTEQIEAIDRGIDRVNVWRANNPRRCKTPDAKGEKLLDKEGT
jgi:hypothetical protein